MSDGIETTVLARASSQTSTSTRWIEITIERVDGGRYCVRQEGHSLVAGETLRVSDVLVESGVAAAAPLRRPGAADLSLPALRALTDAAQCDPVFAAGLDELLYEDVLPSGRSVDTGGYRCRFVIARDRRGSRPLRFLGTMLASTTSRVDEADPSWTEIKLYRVADGPLVGVKQRVATDGQVDAKLVVTCASAEELVRTWTRPGTGWVEGALLEVLARACAVDAAIAAEITSADVAGWARRIVGSTTVQPGDYRYQALESLLAGFTILSEDSFSGPVVKGWEAPKTAETAGSLAKLPEPPEVSRQLFLALSRRRLIELVGERAGIFTWTISLKGRAVFEQAQQNERKEVTK